MPLVAERSASQDGKMLFSLKTFLLVGIISGTIIHFVTQESMPWWPDTAIMGAAFRAFAALGNIQHRRTNQRAWNALKRMFRRSEG